MDSWQHWVDGSTIWMVVLDGWCFRTWLAKRLAAGLTAAGEAHMEMRPGEVV